MTHHIHGGTVLGPPNRPARRLPSRPAPSPAPGYRKANHGERQEVAPVIVLRREIGDVLRTVRQHQGRTLREVSSAARVSLGYLSEVERGQKEASSELLASICTALNIPMSFVLRKVSDRIAVAEGVHVPDTVPEELVSSLRKELAGVA
ncbi:helix-turn-helix transcriptional regulator [Georgenia sp. 311]|uniref:Helix-turn-helix transcriptional regulator n=1 Tax=Georgenia wutianyii TaxID=2585135 RepID=A0ABX5VKY9_9MICO|nr:helix-turn-helix transcriptional regulator [Georgenia wutianyii]TNC16706.1 helix-turn-helix transcriptional regulator [Georgenia sp. 311]